MHRYFFVLGKNPALSIVEIVSTIKKSKIHCDLQVISQEIVTISATETTDVSHLMKTLGGSVKVGEIMDEARLDEDESKFYKIFDADNLLSRYFPQISSKLHLGISLYNGGDVDYLTFLFKQLKDLNVKVKENLQQAGKKVGFVRIKERALSSVSVAKNQLLKKGTEIVIILTPTSILVGKTLAVQEFAQFSFRDYGRPARDKSSGILPPKLARIMINMTDLPTSAIILDPFCGSGTILQEAILLGFKNIIGSDISHKAIADTKANLDWLFKNFPQANRSSYNIKLFQTDIQFIIKHIQPNSIDAVVTEPFLGPPLFNKPSITTIGKILLEMSNLYVNTFSKLAKILKSKGKIVTIFPVFEENGRLYFVEILEKIKKLGFQQKFVLEKPLSGQRIQGFTSRGTMLYGSSEQFVKREILVFEKIT